MRALAGAALALAVLLGGCSSAPQPVADLARDLADKVGVDGMYTHLRKLAEIADANNGSRAEGTPGYDASVDYVAQTLRDKGFDVADPRVRAARRGVAGEADAHGIGPCLSCRPGLAADRRPRRAGCARRRRDRRSLRAAWPPTTGRRG